LQLTHARVRAADRYAPTADLSIVTAYFNPAGFRSRRQNYEQFCDRIRAAGIPLITVECALGDRSFELPPGPGVRRVRGRDVMWQKERLLNLAIADLPDTCRKIAWLDADILFENPDWAPATAALLDRFPVVQMFDRAVRLCRGVLADEGHGDSYSGFAAVYSRQPHCLLTGDFAAHGHTGFAWAARRDVLAGPGLYDACIAGSGDHMMAHAFCGDWASACVSRIIGTANHHRRYFADWCRAIYPRVRARVGFVAGSVLHLWHGEVGDRRYVDRNQELAEFGFDPATDVRVGQDGCWEWANRKPALHRWAAAYFGRRREDGDNTGGGPDGTH
jgi:hypothetical protein